jgi:nitrate/nitrite transporter NarK
MVRQKADPLNTISGEDLRLMTIIHSAIAGASVAAVVQISGREQLNMPLYVALACFAVALPISLMIILLLNYRAQELIRSDDVERKRRNYWPSSWAIQAFRYLTYVACFGGFLGIFWNFHAVIGLIFLLSGSLAFAIAYAAERNKANPPQPEPAIDEEGGVPVS